MTSLPQSAHTNMQSRYLLLIYRQKIFLSNKLFECPSYLHEVVIDSNALICR